MSLKLFGTKKAPFRPLCVKDFETETVKNNTQLIMMISA